MESWRKVWRYGFCPHLPTAGLEALQGALLADDFRLIQGATSIPAPLQCVKDWPVEAACAVGFCGWKGGDIGDLVGEVEEFFSKACFYADHSLGDPGGCRWFLNAYDEWPRQEMIRNLLPEVERELSRRSEMQNL